MKKPLDGKNTNVNENLDNLMDGRNIRIKVSKEQCYCYVKLNQS